MIPKPSRKLRLSAKAAAREAAIFRRAEIRSDAITRSRGRCEWCGVQLPPGELHHIVGGSGRRRQVERLDTVAFVCVTCHHNVHKADRDTLIWALGWAARHGFVEAREELHRRFLKVSPA